MFDFACHEAQLKPSVYTGKLASAACTSGKAPSILKGFRATYAPIQMASFSGLAYFK